MAMFLGLLKLPRMSEVINVLALTAAWFVHLQELPLGPMAMSLGLLKLPRMPEVKKGSAANALDAFTASTVDPDSVKFKDKQREKQRQQVCNFVAVFKCSSFTRLCLFDMMIINSARNSGSRCAISCQSS
jgi:hypothetical protein